MVGIDMTDGFLVRTDPPKHKIERESIDVRIVYGTVWFKG